MAVVPLLGMRPHVVGEGANRAAALHPRSSHVVGEAVRETRCGGHQLAAFERLGRGELVVSEQPRWHLAFRIFPLVPCQRPLGDDKGKLGTRPPPRHSRTFDEAHNTKKVAANMSVAER